jgi:uncharacterized membrane protein YeaQ/YmgE (transglycosylase-associated protein family)
MERRRGRPAGHSQHILSHRQLLHRRSPFFPLPRNQNPNASFLLILNAERLVGIVWTIIIGFVAGLIAKFIVPGRNEPRGFVLTAVLGIVGALVASYLGQALNIYAPGEGAGLIGAVVGAVIVLVVWGIFARRRT